ncbi:MAG: methylenetetrahydrofolate reductase [Gammaproteobacteria bacterium]
MKFEDEPVPGQPFAIRPGHSSGGRLERILREGVFAVTAELNPPDSADAEDVYRRARVFDGYVDAMNATDGAGANCHMSSVAVCALLRRIGYAPVMQVSCRDKNRIAIQGDVLGSAALGVCNILCLTGDGVQAGDDPGAKAVFDLDSVSLLETIRIMREESRLRTGRKLDSPPRVFLGASANPFAEPVEFQAIRLAKKIAAGAQFIQTQYCFDVERFRNFMTRARDMGLLEQVFILAGVGPPTSARAARWMRAHVPGVHIPDTIIDRLDRAEDQKAEGQKICIELIQQLREIEGVSGVHIMAYRQEQSIATIVRASGVLDGRTPWYPGRE